MMTIMRSKIVNVVYLIEINKVEIPYMISSYTRKSTHLNGLQIQVIYGVCRVGSLYCRVDSLYSDQITNV